MSARTRRVAVTSPPRPACPRCGGPTGAWSGYVRHLRDAELAPHRRAPGALPALRENRGPAALVRDPVPLGHRRRHRARARARDQRSGRAPDRGVPRATRGDRPGVVPALWPDSDVVARVLLAAAVRAGWWAEGLAGLHNRPRSDRGAAPVSPALLDEAIRLGLQVPARSAVHISEIVFAPPRRAHRRAHPERAGPAAGLHPNRAAARRTRVRAVRGRRSQRALDRRRPRGAPSCPTGGLPAPCGPACPRSSTITAASSSMAAGSATRPCVRARRCSTRRSCAGACPPSSA